MTREDQLKSILTLLGSSATKQEVLDAFQKVIQHVKDVKKQNETEWALINSAFQMLEKRVTESTKNSLEDFKKQLTEQHKGHLKVIKDKLATIKDGEDGEDGKDGKTPTAEELIALIKPLIPDPIPGEKGEKGDPGEAGASGRPMIGWGAHPLVIQDSTSVVDEVARNIKFTGATLSRDSDGVVTVAISSAGFTQLTATGTVNGVNKTFTFTSKPTYIISDGVWYRENHGWTYSGSTATMDVPPTNDIYGAA